MNIELRPEDMASVDPYLNKIKKLSKRNDSFQFYFLIGFILFSFIVLSIFASYLRNNPEPTRRSVDIALCSYIVFAVCICVVYLFIAKRFRRESKEAREAFWESKDLKILIEKYVPETEKKMRADFQDKLSKVTPATAEELLRSFFESKILQI